MIDTFKGFEREQFSADMDLGVRRTLAREFRANSKELARWVMDRHGGKEIDLIKGNISTISRGILPQKISACLLDVDLAGPVFDGLQKVFPLLERDGIIAIDDCEPSSGYQARIGYEKFIQQFSLTPEYRYGMGFVRKAGDQT